jgi:hypothetical protein
VARGVSVRGQAGSRMLHTKPKPHVAATRPIESVMLCSSMECYAARSCVRCRRDRTAPYSSNYAQNAHPSGVTSLFVQRFTRRQHVSGCEILLPGAGSTTARAFNEKADYRPAANAPLPSCMTASRGRRWGSRLSVRFGRTGNIKTRPVSRRTLTATGPRQLSEFRTATGRMNSALRLALTL